MGRQHAAVQHVRGWSRPRRRGAGRATLVRRGVAVERGHADVRRRRQGAHQLAQRLALVARERLGREQQQRARVRVRQRRLQDGHLEAQRLARGRARGDDDVAPCERGRDRGGLVLERRCDATSRERLEQTCIEGDRGGRPRAHDARARGGAVLRDELDLVVGPQSLDGRVQHGREISGGSLRISDAIRPAITGCGNVSFSRAGSSRSTVACPLKKDPGAGEA
ncbi:MAG: hypothetical protein U0168_22815 [Nannocystaceae bacterium]